MIPLADFLARGVVPFFAVALVSGLALAALSRDLGKRLLGGGLAAFAAVAAFAVMTRDDAALRNGAAAAAILVLAALALGQACLMRVREGFGGIDAGGLRIAEDGDDRAERGG